MRARATRADLIILAGAGLYFAWSLVPRWFTFVPVSRYLYSPFAGPSPVNAGLLDGLWAVIGLLCTTLGLAIHPWHYGADWGVWVGIGLALAWSWGALLKLVEPVGP